MDDIEAVLNNQLEMITQLANLLADTVMEKQSACGKWQEEKVRADGLAIRVRDLQRRNDELAMSLAMASKEGQRYERELEMGWWA